MCACMENKYCSRFCSFMVKRGSVWVCAFTFLVCLRLTSGWCGVCGVGGGGWLCYIEWVFQQTPVIFYTIKNVIE